MIETQTFPRILADLTCVRALDGTRVYWTDPNLSGATAHLSQTDFAHPSNSNNIVLLKSARQRFIYSCTTPFGPMVVKLFPLSLVSSLKHRKYAATEFVNTLKADDLGLSVPRVHAYLEKRQGLRVSCVGIVFEELQGYQELSRLLRRGIFSVEKCGTIAAETLAQLYAVGANHLDGRDANIMVHPETGQIRVIDWQFANFVAPRAEWLLEHLAGFHLQRSHEYRNYYLDSYWLQELHALSNHTSSIQLFRDRVVSLSKRKYSLGKRSKLTPLSG